MEIIIELPDEAASDVTTLLEWLHGPERQLPAAGAAVWIGAPPGPGGHVFAWRLIDVRQGSAS